jgi:hypothetical protein
MTHEDAAGQTYWGWSDDFPAPDQTTSKHGADGAIAKETKPWNAPVVLGDPPAKVAKVYGQPRKMTVDFVAWPLRGEFENGKLIEWKTDPPPLVV